VFAFGRDLHRVNDSEGSVLLLALVIVTVLGIFVGSIALRFNTLIKNQSSIEYQNTTLGWGRAISERIDCLRTMGTFNSSNRCPVNTSRSLTFLNEAPLSANGPQSSQHIGKNWYAKVVCGTDDLVVNIARYENSRFDQDPLTGRVLDFANGKSQISGGGYDIPMCPSYFGSGQPSVRILGMTKATHQKISIGYNLYGPAGTAVYLPHECDGKLGMVAELDDTPLRDIYRLGGASSPPSSTNLAANPKFVYDVRRAEFNDWGQTSNLEPDWIYVTPRFLGSATMAGCVQICIKHGMATGILTKCDPSASASDPPLGVTRWDDTSAQVNCLCIR